MAIVLLEDSMQSNTKLVDLVLLVLRLAVDRGWRTNALFDSVHVIRRRAVEVRHLSDRNGHNEVRYRREEGKSA